MADKPPLVRPTLHLNGTSRDELTRNYERASHALRRALEALRDAAPNGRDYYPQGDDAMRAAQAQHARRVAAVDEVLGEVMDLHEGVVDGVSGARP